MAITRSTMSHRDRIPLPKSLHPHGGSKRRASRPALFLPRSKSIPFAADNVGANDNQVRAVDFNSKGLQDLMAFDQNRGMVSTLSNQGTGNFASSHDIYVGNDVKYVLTGDVNGDKLHGYRDCGR